jgi:hypothetical protein
MEAQLIIPKANGQRVTYILRMHHNHGRDEVKIAMNTTEEDFNPWVFYLLRDIGAHIVTDKPEVLRAALGLSRNDSGVQATAGKP